MKIVTRLILIVFTLITLHNFAQDDGNNQPYLKANIGHTDVVTDFVLSIDNKYLASCSEDRTIILWDFATGKEIKTISGHKNDISCIDISTDNEILVAGEGSADETQNYIVKIWDIKSGEEIQSIEPNAGRLKLVKFSDENKSIYIGGAKKIVFFDIDANSVIREYVGFSENLKNISFSHNQKFISANGDNKIYLWDVNNREPIKVIDQNSTKVTSIALGPKANSIVVGGEDNSIRIYNTITGNENDNFTLHRYPIFKLAVDGESEIIASCDKKSGFYKILEYNTGKELHTIDAHAGRVGLIKITSNNLFIITAGSWDRKIKVWNIENGELVKSFSGIEKNRYQHVYIDSSRYYAIGSQRNDVFINFMTKKVKNKEFKGKNGEVACIALSNDKKLMAFGTAENYISVINASSHEEIFSSSSHISWIRNIAFSPDSKYLATGSYKQIKIWNIETGEQIVSIDKKFKIPHNIAFSTNSDLIAIGGKKATKVFDIKTGKQTNKFRTKKTAKSLDFSNSDRYLATGYENQGKDGKFKINVWELGTKKPIKTLAGHEHNITSVEFGSNDSIIATSGRNKIKIWDVNSAKEMLEIEAHARWINDIEFSENNEQLISSSEDGTVKIWDVSTGNLLLTEIGLEGTADWISYTPDGRFNGTEEGIKSFYFVKDMQIVPLENLYEKFYTPQLNAEISKNFRDGDLSISELENLPDIAITKPSSKAPVFRGSVETLLTTDQKTTSVYTEVTDMGGGVDEIRVYQNNKLVESKKVGVNQAGEKIAEDFDINLAKGLNIIEVASYNNDRTKNSKRIGIEYTGDEFNPANLYVFAIGINSYKKPTYNLNYAISDASSFVSELTNNSETIFKSTNIISLTNEQATKDSIVQCFNQIKETAEQNDVFVFYYAGHGSMSAPEPDSEAEFYLIPWEVTNLYNNQMLKTMGISAQKLQEFSKEIKAQKQLFVLDACQSGGAVEYLASRGSEEERAIAQLAHSTGTYFITASGSQQLAGEFGSLGHGVFTYAILEGLKGNASVSEGKVTVKGLTFYVEEQVPILSEKYKGSAQYPTSYGFGQDFPLVLRNNE